MKTVLAVAATDSCGGAGLAADVRAIAACGAHAAVAVTAVTAQSTLSVESVFPVPGEAVRAQIDAVLGDMPVACVKSGVLGSAEVAAVIAATLPDRGIPYVLDPVAVATSGGLLCSPDTIDAMTALLFPLATLITPNAVEAAALTGLPVRDPAEAAQAARALLDSGCGAVLVKGGHLSGDEAVDVLVTPTGTEQFVTPRLENPNTHGTGCTLASAIAAHLANGRGLFEAVRLAREYVAGAIEAGYQVGGGPGPVDHLWRVRRGLQWEEVPS